ncbi:nuclease A inhibitor family protein [Mucilaginibacter koreensis]
MNTIQTKLENAASGLLMMSESDEPFTYVSAPATTINEQLALSLAGKPAGTPVETITLDYLLRNMTNPASGSVSPATAQKFSQLAAALKQELAGLTVYRVGEVQIDVFILGKANDGSIAGMRTRLIET